MVSLYTLARELHKHTDQSHRRIDSHNVRLNLSLTPCRLSERPLAERQCPVKLIEFYDHETMPLPQV